MRKWVPLHHRKHKVNGTPTPANPFRLRLCAYYGGRALKQVLLGNPNNAAEVARVAAHHYMEGVGRGFFALGNGRGVYDELSYRPNSHPISDDDGGTYEAMVPPGRCACMVYA